MQDKMLYTIGEYAKIMGVNPMTVRRWIKSGEIKSIRKGKIIRIPHDELEVKKGD